jgi:hypothetical protein
VIFDPINIELFVYHDFIIDIRWRREIYCWFKERSSLMSCFIWFLFSKGFDSIIILSAKVQRISLEKSYNQNLNFAHIKRHIEFVPNSRLNNKKFNYWWISLIITLERKQNYWNYFMTLFSLFDHWASHWIAEYVFN